jgi:hypothetical protein
VSMNTAVGGNQGLTHPLFHVLEELAIEPHEFVIFGSGPLLVHGIRTQIRDLDVVAHGSAWKRASAVGESGRGTVTGDPSVHLLDGRIQFHQRWISKRWDTEELISRAVVIGGLRFAPLPDVLAYKRMLRRGKDIIDIRAALQAEKQAQGS